MKRVSILILLAVAFALSPAVDAANDTPQWEELPVRQTVERELPAQQDAVEVVVRDGAVYITALQPVKVEVFSILGQLITTRRIGEGTVRLTLRQRGVYILKAGSVTKRINL